MQLEKVHENAANGIDFIKKAILYIEEWLPGNTTIVMFCLGCGYYGVDFKQIQVT